MVIKNYLNIIEKSKSKKQYITLAVIFAFVVLFTQQVNMVYAGTGINQQIPYSGSIVNNAGVAWSDGNKNMKFEIYNVASGGVPVYTQIGDISGTPTTTVKIEGGRFDVLLGSVTALPTLNDDSLYMQISMDADNNALTGVGGYEEVFTPRRRIGSALSAINSLRLVAASGGADTDTLSLDSSGNVIATSLGGTANGSLGINDRILLANSSGQFSQVSSSIFSLAGTNWSLLGNTLSSSSGAIGVAPTGSFLGTVTGNANSLQFATDGLTRLVLTSTGDLLTSQNVVIGNGDTNNSPAVANLMGTNASGTDIGGNNFTLTAGRGTGTGVGGDLLFATAPAGLTGSTLNASVTRLRITSAGNIGIGVNSPVAKLDVNTDALANPTTNLTYAQSGISLSNSTTASTGVQQFSPTLRWRGAGFATTPIQSQNVEFISYLQPIQGTTAPSANLIFASSINNSIYTTRMTLTNAGTVGITGSFSAGSSVASVRTGLITTSTDGLFTNNTTAATAAVPVQIAPRIRLSGAAWNTTATAASNTINWAIENIPVSGAIPSSALNFNFDRNGLGYSTVLSLLSGGNLGIGVTNPTAKLQLAAGTATASTSPLKFTAGTNLTTPEVGAIEWNGTNLFLTTNTSVRQTINQGLAATATLDFPSTANASFSALTVSVTNAALGDVVSLGIPDGSVPAAAVNFSAWVSAANTVTVRFTNNSGSAQDPVSGSFKVFVTKF